MADDGGEGEGAFLGNRGRSPCLDIIGIARSRGHRSRGQVVGRWKRQVARDQGETGGVGRKGANASAS